MPDPKFGDICIDGGIVLMYLGERGDALIKREKDGEPMAYPILVATFSRDGGPRFLWNDIEDFPEAWRPKFFDPEAV